MINTYVSEGRIEQVERFDVLSHLEETVFHCSEGSVLEITISKPVLSTEFYSDCYLFSRN